MSANIINKSGSTSTFIPGGTGNSGKRAAVTFYGTYNEEQISNPVTFILNDSSVTISNIYGSSIIPDIGDCIVYSEPNNTYLLYITEKITGGYIVNISNIWNTQSSQSGEQKTDISNIELNVTCVNNISQMYHGFKSNIVDRILSSYNIDVAGFRGEKDPNSLYVNSVCGFTFSVTSLNSLPLGEYKLQIEFITDWTSPGMDTRIAKKFQTPQLYSGILNYPTNTGEKCTLRGYITNYSCKGSKEEYSRVCPNCGSITNITWINGWLARLCMNCHQESPLPKNPEVVSENFDDEKLDNFEVTIKDYSDGIGELSYQTTTFIPIDVLKNAYNAGYPYKCLLYLYVDGANSSKEKIFMRDMSSTFNAAVLEADSSVYSSISNINDFDDITHDPIIHVEKYAGTEHSGQNTNIIYLGNSGEEVIRPADDIITDINEIQQDTIIDSNVNDPREYIDNVYVNNINIQKNAGSGNWCHCTYDSVNHKLKYKATSDNTTGSIRYAYFVHTTTDNTLSYGPNAGSAAMSQWTVTVRQSTKPKSNGNGSGGGGEKVIIAENDDKIYNI